MSTTTNRLTSTRFFAAMSAVFFHIPWLGKAVPNEHLRLALADGPTAVSYFFCLSGFVMALTNAPNRFLTDKYWLARFARIYPVYLIALVWFSTVQPITGKAWALNLLLINSWVPGYSLSGNPPGWSLATEVAFYFSFPIFIRFLTDARLKRATIFAIAFWIASMAAHRAIYLDLYPTHPFPSPVHDILFYWPVFHFGEFFLGAVVGAWFKRLAIMPSGAFDFSALASAFLIYTLIALKGELGTMGFPTSGYANGLLAPLILVFIYSLPRAKGAWARMFEWKPLLVLGEASYVMYLFQIPLLVCFLRFDLPAWAGVTSTLGTIGLYVASLIAISLIAWAAIEEPMRNFIKKLPEIMKSCALKD
ncbi:acyltransferase family protein [Paraburkholderia aromaticivorans]|uniref:acyltransferase family protein n=1 Tax=Paraburkholderia aromaticivorans TaxID=2026199 RepID=UPI0038B794E4